MLIVHLHLKLLRILSLEVNVYLYVFFFFLWNWGISPNDRKDSDVNNSSVRWTVPAWCTFCLAMWICCWGTHYLHTANCYIIAFCANMDATFFILAELLPYSRVWLLGKRDVDFRSTQQLGNPNVCGGNTRALCQHVWQQNSANLRNRVTYCVLRDVLHRTYHGVLDVRRVTLCHGTDVNVTCPSLRRFSWNL